MTAQDEVPAGVDLTRPSVARGYDYCLFGKNNYEVDREALRKVAERTPEVVPLARQNRAYLVRVVRYLAEECGIRQFVDHGSGLPTQQNVHQVAQAVDPSAKVVYIDNDPVVLAHGRALLAENDSTTVITADMARPEEILANPDVKRLIDFSRPVGLLYLSVLHLLNDEEDPWGAVARMLAAVPSGSYLAVSTVTAGSDDRIAAEIDAVLRERFHFGRVRRPEEIHRFFDGLQVVDPGLGAVAEWRLDLGPRMLPRPVLPEDPDDPADWPAAWRDDAEPKPEERTWWEYGGVARKP